MKAAAGEGGWGLRGDQNVAELNGSSRGCSLSASLLIAGCGAVQSTPRNRERHAAIRSLGASQAATTVFVDPR